MPILGTSASSGLIPSAPIIGTATAGDGSATVTFTAPSWTGKGSGTVTYTATSSPGGLTGTTTSGTSITVSGLTNGTTYTFTVTATNENGTSAASNPSNYITTSRYSTVGWWDLNTYSSVTLTDLSGNGYDGTYNSAANGYFTSQNYNGYVGRGISGKAATPCFTISKAYNLTECTIIAIGAFGGANNGKYAFLCSNSGLTDNLTFTMDAGGGDAGHPYIYGNGGYAVTSNAYGSGPVRMYSTVIPSSTSQVTLPKIKINAQDAALREYGLPPSTITHTIGSLMRIDEYNGIGSAVWWEIKVFSKALTATELSNEEAYFKTKWGF